MYLIIENEWNGWKIVDILNWYDFLKKYYIIIHLVFHCKTWSFYFYNPKCISSKKWTFLQLYFTIFIIFQFTIFFQTHRELEKWSLLFVCNETCTWKLYKFSSTFYWTLNSLLNFNPVSFFAFLKNLKNSNKKIKI